MFLLRLLLYIVIFVSPIFARAPEGEIPDVDEFRDEKFLSFVPSLGYQGGIMGGIAVALNQIKERESYNLLSMYSLGCEASGKSGGMFGGNLGCWFSGSGVGVGGEMVMLFGSSHPLYVLRPTLGAGTDDFKLTYGYNMFFTAKDSRMGQHTIAFSYFFHI
ncbi:MAG: hypothetical protein LWX56_07680 [Ignavibacteria bacterium]|nr:hypothetical protein [Ignavibacteria bacterium]